MALWGGRFSQAADTRFKQFNDSLRFDYRLAEQDITGSIAWSKALLSVGVLNQDEQSKLEEALLEFAGCAVVISHDRWFLDRIATHMLAFEGDSHVEWFEGNFSDYEEDLKRRKGADAAQPHRIKYKPITKS